MKLLLAALLCIVFSDVVLEKRTLLNNKIEILVPKEFKEMPEDAVKIKYPGKNRPQLILTDEPGTTNLAFSLVAAEIDASLISQYLQQMSSAYKSRFPTAKWIKEGTATINNKQVGYFKFITEALDQKIFNYIFMTDIDGKLMIGTFNCVEKDMATWQDTADKIVASLKERK